MSIFGHTVFQKDTDHTFILINFDMVEEKKLSLQVVLYEASQNDSYVTRWGGW